jgi:hypothetical protein
MQRVCPLRTRQPRQLEVVRSARASVMTSDQPRPFEFLDGAGNKAGADANGDQLSMRGLQDAIVLTAMAKMFAHQELQDSYGGQAKSRVQYPLNHVTR